MSTKHLFPDSSGLVVKSLRGLLRLSPHLRLIESTRVLYDSSHSSNTVSVISGGGSGHEPAFGGYVGKNMLAAAVAGDIFASPTTKQILSAIESVPSDRGTLLVVLNYTGDCINFGLAAEKANSKRPGSCKVVIVGEDASVGGGGGLVGRRGLAAQVGVIKILGAAAAQGMSLADLVTLGKAVATQSASIAVTLDHCHVPGRLEHDMLPEGEIELGTGPHNETGYKKLNPTPQTPELIATVLNYILDESDPERGYISLKADDEVVLLLSNFGGLSELEMGALTDEVLAQLQKLYNISPVRTYTGNILTSLNAPGFSASIINLSGASRVLENIPYAALLSFLDEPTPTAWAALAGSQPSFGLSHRSHASQIGKSSMQEARQVDESSDFKMSPVLLTRMLSRALTDLIAAEPDLTAWDTVMGDGDCGETLKRGAQAVQSALDLGLAKSGSVGLVLREVESIVEDKMGGTLGGILGILFVGLSSELARGVAKRDQNAGSDRLWGMALSRAIDGLSGYTPAKVGDRTVMDVLIPFAESLTNGGFEAAVVVAQEKAEATRRMKAKLGRATYVGGLDNSDTPPDPGAWAAMVVLKGLWEGMKE